MKKVNEDHQCSAPEKRCRYSQVISSLCLRPIYADLSHRKYSLRYFVAMMMVTAYPLLFIPMLAMVMHGADQLALPDSHATGLCTLLMLNMGFFALISFLLFIPGEHLAMKQDLGDIWKYAWYFWAFSSALMFLALILSVFMDFQSVIDEVIVSLGAGTLLFVGPAIAIIAFNQILAFQLYLSRNCYNSKIVFWLVVSILISFFAFVAIGILGAGGSSEAYDLLLLVPPFLAYLICTTYWFKSAYQILICWWHFDQLKLEYEASSEAIQPETSTR